MDYNDVLNAVGSFGRFQKWICVMVFVGSLPCAFSNLMFAFAHFMPDFHCSIPGAEELARNSTEYQELLNRSLPWEKNSDGRFERSQCKMFHSNLNATSNASFENSVSVLTGPCKYGWTYDSGNTAIAEFNLVCEDAWKAPFATMLYMAGMGLGSLLGRLSDRFGRRPVFLISTFSLFIGSGLTGFAWSYASYSVFGFVTGISGINSYVTAYVLATETMDVRRRAAMGLFVPATYTVGYILTPALGSLLPYWRHYLWAVALFGILYIPLILLCPESLRWLLVSGKREEAIGLLKRIAAINGRTVDAEKIYNDFQVNLAQTRKARESEKKYFKTESSYLHFLSNKTMLVRSCVVYLGWFISSMLYFAISLNPSALSGNHYVNMFLSGLVEFPAFALAYLLLRNIGRIRPSFAFFSVAGISCCIAPFLKQAAPTVVTVLVLIGKGSVTGAFNVFYIVAAEITPTMVRNTTMGVASAFARLGAVVMPYLMFAGQTVNPILPFLVMGVLALITGLLTMLVMPETRGVPMPDTIKGALQNKRIYGFNMFKTFAEEESGEEKEKLQMNPMS